MQYTQTVEKRSETKAPCQSFEEDESKKLA